MRIYGYVRISRKHQDPTRQIRNIKREYPDAIIVVEVYTGTKMQGRKELDKILSKVESGDMIVFDSASRMARNANEAMELYEDLFNRDISLVFLKEHHIDTETFKNIINSQINITLNTGNDATDEFINTLVEALKKYSIALAKEQIRKVFEQAEKEVEDLHQRVKEGIETARLNGKQIGGVKGSKYNVKKSQPTKDLILKYNIAFNGSLNDTECIKLIGIARNTFYKYKKELLEEF